MDVYKKENSFKPPVLFKEISKHYLLYIMIIPLIVYLVLFCYCPMGGVIVAFKNFNITRGILRSEWAGMFYFKQLFNDSYFWSVFKNSIIISTMKLIFTFPLPVIIAIALNEFRSSTLKKTVQTIIYLPRFLSWMIVAGLMFNLFALDGGALNKWLTDNGKETINILANPSNFRWMLVVTEALKGAGWGSIIYMAAISGIDVEMFDAAIVDGAGRFRQIYHIIIPSILPVISILLILSIGGIMNAGFDQIFVLYNPAVYSVGDIIDTYVYRKGLLDSKYSYSTAAGLFKSIIGLVLIVVSNFACKKIGQEGLF